MSHDVQLHGSEFLTIRRLVLARIRGAARRLAPRAAGRRVDDVLDRAFRRTWPGLRAACLTGRPLDPGTLAELRTAAVRLQDLGVSRSGMIDLTRTVAEVTERQIAVVGRRVDAVRALRYSRYAMVALHDLIAALLGPAGAAPPASGEPGDDDDVSGLEREILRRLADGQSSSEIAGGLHYSKQAVSYHLSRLLSKYQVPNRTALVAAAYERGVLPVRAGSGRAAS